MSAGLLVVASLLADLCADVPPARPDPYDAPLPAEAGRPAGAAPGAPEEAAPAPGAPAAPAPAPDAGAEESASYLRVGDAERASGHTRTAAVAYRRALELDPGNARARRALGELCRADATPAPPPPPPPADPEADADRDLEAGLSRYRAGDLGGALPLLERATRGADSGGAAHFFLGMLAYRRHETEVALRELRRAARDPRFTDLAEEMLRIAAQESFLVVSLVTQTEVDSNVELLPDTPPSASTGVAPRSDASLLVLGAVELRPASGLLLRESVFWRDQRELSQLDFLRERLEARYRVERDRHRADARYELDYALLDGARYLVAHRFGLAYRYLAGERLTLAGRLEVRRRDFAGSERAAFDGFVDVLGADAMLQLGDRWELELGLTGTREGTSDPVFANLAGGASAKLRFTPVPRWHLSAGVRGALSGYDAAQADGRLRRDAHGEAALELEVDVGDAWVLFLGADAVGNDSNIEDFRYHKLAAHVGVAVSFAAP